ncbi:MAG: 50S ribosomal protein L11 [Candidatus Paceibacterota bacterium]|jgi:large subunit ribosomal protein L11
MAKKIKSVVKIQIKAAKATPAPPIGPSLAPHGINLADFCKRFNDATREMGDFIIPAEITVYEDRTYEFILKQPPVADLLKKAAGIEKGSGKPNAVKCGKVTKDQVRKIAEQKMPDLNTKNIEAAMRIVEGTARSLGLEVK